MTKQTYDPLERRLLREDIAKHLAADVRQLGLDGVVNLADTLAVELLKRRRIDIIEGGENHGE